MCATVHLLCCFFSPQTSKSTVTSDSSRIDAHRLVAWSLQMTESCFPGPYFMKLNQARSTKWAFFFFFFNVLTVFALETRRSLWERLVGSMGFSSEPRSLEIAIVSHDVSVGFQIVRPKVAMETNDSWSAPLNWRTTDTTDSGPRRSPRVHSWSGPLSSPRIHSWSGIW